MSSQHKQLVLREVYKEVRDAFDQNVRHFTQEWKEGWTDIFHNSINWLGEIGLLGYMRLYK